MVNEISTSNLKYLKNKVERISNEVKELHPLLKEILPNLDNVNNVEYTHGQYEKGADFVIEKYDTTLKETLYIGVVVKIGKIHSNLSDVERQIDECELGRYFSEGKKRIKLSEIWVIINSNITNAAKEKIHHKFVNSKISFIAGDKLLSWVDLYTPYFWHDVPTQIGKYLLNINKKMDELDTAGRLLPSDRSDEYIELDIIPLENQLKKKSKKDNSIDIFDELVKKDVIVVEGDMGAGKSKLAREVVRRYASVDSYTENNIIPIFVTYRMIVDKYKLNVRDCINDQLGEAIGELKDSDITLIVIDGLDEVDAKEESEKNNINNLFDNILSESKVKAFITTRPLKNIDKEALMYKSADKYSIKPLSTSKLIRYLDKVCLDVNISKRVIEDIKKSHLFKQLPKSPIAAILLSNLLYENQKELPSNLTELFSKSLELMLGRWGIEKGLYTQKQYEAADKITGQIAMYMQDYNLDRISLLEAKDFFVNYLKDRNLDLSVDDLFDKVINRSCVFSSDIRDNVLWFKHRSFMEFMYAKYAISKNGLPINNKVFDVYWLNIYFFYLGLKKDCPDLVQEIVSFPTITEAERWMKLLYTSNYMLAAFASPYDVVRKNLPYLMLEISQLYMDVLDGKTETNLKDLSEIKILWLIQYLVRDSYSYDFFMKSIDGAALTICDSLDDNVKKIYALYFLGMVGYDLENEEPIKLLTESYDIGQIPLSVSVSLRAEMDFNDKVGSSIILKKHKKKFKRLLKGNLVLSRQIKVLVDKPISIEHKK